MAQGLWIRSHIELLPPAEGPTTGWTCGPTFGPALRLGVIGESTAAGCGVEAHATAFTGCLARGLSARGSPVRWHVVGEHGATARRIRHRLMPQLPGDFDVAVVLAGANDVLARRTPEAWREDLAAIVSGLGARSRHVVVTATPPFAAFPSLPRTLARYLAAQGAELDSVSQAVCDGAANVHFVAAGSDLVDDKFFARDGFHPGARGYQRWADLVEAALPPFWSDPQHRGNQDT